MSSQLWRLLITIKNKGKDSLNCSECFAVLELLAEAAYLGGDPTRIERLARQHLAMCPECQERIWERLLKLERIES